MVDPLVLIKSLSFLIFVILSIYFCFFITKKKLKHRFDRPSDRIKVIEKNTSASGIDLILISADDQPILLASSQHAITAVSLSTPQAPVHMPAARL